MALSSSESVSRSPGRRPLSDSRLSVSECSGGGSDESGVGSCVCGVCGVRRSCRALWYTCSFLQL